MNINKNTIIRFKRAMEYREDSIKEENIIKDKSKYFKDEIDLREVQGVISRNKKLVISIATLSLCISGIYLLLRKPVWQGEFQVLLKDNNSALNAMPVTSSGLGAASGSSVFLQGLLNVSSDLKTEVEILKSPSVLFPVYNFVKDMKSKITGKKYKLSYEKWLKKHLRVSLQKQTSVLNLNYRDKDKYLIKKVLNNIVREYKVYSKKDKEDTLNRSLSYLSKQIDLYQKKSDKLIAKKDEFEFNYDLTPALLENLRFVSVNRIRTIDKLLDLLNETKEDEEQFISTIKAISTMRDNYVLKSEGSRPKLSQLEGLSSESTTAQGMTAQGMTAQGMTAQGIVPDGISSNLLVEYDNLLLSLSNLKTKFTPNDPIVAKLEEKRKRYFLLLSNQTFSFLKAQKLKEKALLLSLDRPKEVLIDYRKILAQSMLNETQLLKLMGYYDYFSLEKARGLLPWELITEPVIKDDYLDPRKRNVILFGLIFGFTVGTIGSIYKEKRSGIIYTKKQLENLIGIDNLLVFQPNQNTDSLNSFNMLFNKTLKDSRIRLISLPSLSSDLRESLDNSLQGFTNVIILPLRDIFGDINQKDYFIPIVHIGSTKISEIQELKRAFKLIDIEIQLSILLEP